ncbi:MAG: response regulator [Pseudomonadota bacterium]
MNRATNSQEHVRSILVIDDDPADYMFIARSVAKVAPDVLMHYEADGYQARERIADTNADLVILDLKMPGCSGHEVLNDLKNSANENDRVSVPVIVMSSSTDPKDIVSCYLKHANAYVEKPASIAAYMSLANSLKDFWLEQARVPN